MCRDNAPPTPEWWQAGKEERIRRRASFQDEELTGFTLARLIRVRNHTILSAKEKTLRKMMLLAVMVALAALMLAAAPAMASPKHDGSKGHEGNWDRWDNNRDNWDPWNNNRDNCDPWDNNRGNWDPWNNNNGNCHPFDNVTPQVQVPTQTFVSGSNTINGGSVTSTGDNSNTCVATQNFNNSGGVLDQPSIQQQHSGIGSTVFIGGTFVNAPQQNVTCNPSVQQSASSSSGWDSGWNSGWST